MLACEILVPWPGIEPRPPASAAWSLNHRTIREVPVVNLLIQLLIDMWTVSSFQPIQVGLLWIFLYMFIGECMYAFLLSRIADSKMIYTVGLTGIVKPFRKCLHQFYITIWESAMAPTFGLPKWHSSKELSVNAETQEMWVRSLSWEDPLEEEMATHSSILAWRIPWTVEPGGLRLMQSQSWTRLSPHAHIGAYDFYILVYSGENEQYDMVVLIGIFSNIWTPFHVLIG